MFIRRGLYREKPIATSSLIIVLRNQSPSEGNVVNVCTYLNADHDIGLCLSNLAARKTSAVREQRILQKTLLAHVANWNFLGKDDGFLSFYETYKASSEDMSVYYEHRLAEPRFGSRFYFDKGLVFPKSKVVSVAEDLGPVFRQSGLI